MSFVTSRMRIAFALLAVLLGFALAGPVAAHEERTVATDYTFVVGFINEPAVADELNGVWLSVNKGTTPVEGVGDTLKVTVIFGDQSKELALTPAHGEAGVYEAMFIPTAPGDYTFHFTGTIEGVAVDETFTSSPEGFDSVADRADYEFPVDANGSTGESNVAMPVIVGIVLLLTGAFVLLRRRAGSQAGA